MKALTVCQPHAWAIVHGPKRIENRTWPTRYRGRIWIHAGQSRLWEDDPLPNCVRPSVEQLVFGAILGSVDLVDCLFLSDDRVDYDDPYCIGPICWILANPKPLARPYPIGGKQGLWNIPSEVAKILEAA